MVAQVDVRLPTALRGEGPFAARSHPYDAAYDPGLLAELARVHGVPAELILRQAELFREIIAHISRVPKSYRNIVAKIDDIQRAALWLLSGARTQAQFRHFFGSEAFMRPTKSVAWSLFRRVFQPSAK